MTDVRITLGGAEATLQCTLRAAREVNSQFGSFSEAYRRVAAFDFEAYVGVLTSGLGKPIKEVEDDVFAAGMPALVKPVIEYLNRLANGGNLHAASEEAA